jgi:hypothetical protein
VNYLGVILGEKIPNGICGYVTVFLRSAQLEQLSAVICHLVAYIMNKTFIKEISVPGDKIGIFGGLLALWGGILMLPQKGAYLRQTAMLRGGLCTRQ